MKLILLTILIALNLHADEIVFTKNDHFNKYKALENLQSQNNDLAAIQSLKRLLDTDPQNEIYILDHLSKLYAANGLTDRYISFLNTKIKKSPFSANLNYQLAKEYLGTEKTAQACEKAKFMLPHVSQKEKFYLLLADCSLAANQPDEAISYLDKYINNQSDAALNLKRAELHLKLNHLVLAKIDLDIYFLKAKPNEKAYLLQAELYSKQQFPEKLAELYKRCLESVEVSPTCFLGYLHATKNLDASFKLKHFDKYASTYQNHPDVLIEIGRHYQQMKNFEQAEKMYLSAYQKEPKKIETVSMLFQLYNQQTESQKAFDILSQYMATTDNAIDIQIAQNLQKSLFQKHNSVSQVVAQAPPSQSATVLSNSSRNMYLTKKYTELLLHLKKVKTKTDAEYFLIGNIYYQLNSHGNAKLSWSKVKSTSYLYYKAIFNTVAVMRIDSMKTAANNLFKSTDFPLGMHAQTQKLATLLGQASKRLPANDKKFLDESLKSLLYLEWEQ